MALGYAPPHAANAPWLKLENIRDLHRLELDDVLHECLSQGFKTTMQMIYENDQACMNATQEILFPFNES